MTSRSDLVSLLSRLVELLTKLFTERVELARGELQDSAAKAGRRAVWLLFGALLLAVGVTFLGAAAVRALAPLVGSLSLRLCLVALPLFVAGAWMMRRALRPADVLAGAAPDHADDDRDQRQRQDQVRPGAQPIAGHQPHQ